MNTTPQTILDKIKGENIKPTARWYFVVKHAMLWIPGVAVTVLGAISVAGILYAFTHAGWEYREFVYPSQLEFFLAMAPFIWIASFGVFGSLIIKALRTTHEGYRLSAKKILLGSIITSIVLGIGVFSLDETFKVDSIIRYPVQEREQRVWFSPSDGRLAGFIEEKNENTLAVRDKDNTLWTIDMTELGSTTFPFIKKGESVRIIGTSTEENVFVACAIFPWEIGEFPRPSINNNGQARAIIKREQNNNPNCRILIEGIKKHVRENVKEKKMEERKVKENRVKENER